MQYEGYGKPEEMPQSTEARQDGTGNAGNAGEYTGQCGMRGYAYPWMG